VGEITRAIEGATDSKKMQQLVTKLCERDDQERKAGPRSSVGQTAAYWQTADHFLSDTLMNLRHLRWQSEPVSAGMRTLENLFDNKDIPIGTP
jgi:hypothetical protein